MSGPATSTCECCTPCWYQEILPGLGRLPCTLAVPPRTVLHTTTTTVPTSRLTQRLPLPDALALHLGPGLAPCLFLSFPRGGASPSALHAHMHRILATSHRHQLLRAMRKWAAPASTASSPPQASRPATPPTASPDLHHLRSLMTHTSPVGGLHWPDGVYVINVGDWPACSVPGDMRKGRYCSAPVLSFNKLVRGRVGRARGRGGNRKRGRRKRNALGGGLEKRSMLLGGRRGNSISWGASLGKGGKRQAGDSCTAAAQLLVVV